MAKCKQCGKSGLFHKVNKRGYCPDCERIELLEQEELQLKDDIERHKSESQTLQQNISQYELTYQDEERKIEDIKKNREVLYNKIATEAKKEALASIADQINAQQEQLSSLEKKIVLKQYEVLVLDETIMLESFAIYTPKFKFLTSDEYKQRLNEIRNKQKVLVKIDTAAYGNNSWTVNGSESEGKKMVNDMKKLLLRSFNNECDYCVDNVKFNNIESNKNRIEKSFEALNKLGKIMNAGISDNYKLLKYDELYLAYEYHQKKEQEKEEAKKAREELREQQKIDKEIKEARDKIVKEKKHFTAAIKEFETKLKEVTDEKERELITQNLNEAKEHITDLEKEDKVIDYREQNAKAGYVYVISNIGAFGEGVYKIGMTRRLEPMERVDELGDASVPFEFDVHALIFSDNAPELEAKLHEYFYNNRINKINARKEFYKADINEIEKVIKEHYNKVVDVVKEASAEQYRESLMLARNETIAP
jgi:uncharacterized Zn finger protein (UPF0148 family)